MGTAGQKQEITATHMKLHGSRSPGVGDGARLKLTRDGEQGTE